MRIIDERFLTPHPATLDWWDQREKCELCAHMHLSAGAYNEAVMRCWVAPRTMHGRAVEAMHSARGIVHVYCIDARLPEGACGPEAKLFAPIPCKRADMAK
jgi:hypothetical protein